MTIEQSIAENCFLGYERHAVHRLRRSIPKTESTADLFADVRLMALEAAKSFDSTRGVRFETFLYRHLQIKSLEKLRNYWRARRRPPSVSAITPDETPSVHCPVFEAEVRGLFTKVSRPTRSLLQKALDNNTRELRIAFGLRTWRFKVGTLLGVSVDSVSTAVEELKREIPTHISSVEV